MPKSQNEPENEQHLLPEASYRVIGQLSTGVTDQAEVIEENVIRLHRDRLISGQELKFAHDLANGLTDIFAVDDIKVMITCHEDIEFKKPGPGSAEILNFCATELREGELQNHLSRIEEIFGLFLHQLKFGMSESDCTQKGIETPNNLTCGVSKTVNASIGESVDNLLRQNATTQIRSPLQIHVGPEPQKKEPIEVDKLRRVYHKTSKSTVTGTGIIYAQFFRDNKVILRKLAKSGIPRERLAIRYDPDPEKKFKEQIKSLESLNRPSSFTAIKYKHHDGSTSYELVEISAVKETQRELDLETPL